MALSFARAAPEPPLSYDNFYGGGYKCLQSKKIGNTGTKIMSGQNKEKSGHQFGAGPKLNGSARYYRAFMLLFQQAQFSRLHRDSGDGQPISKSIVKP